MSFALAAALLLGIGLPTPHDLPSLALGSREVLWGERTLIFFYGFLLLFVPLIRALQGQLPIELSTRGARWQETAAASEYALAALNQRVDALSREIQAIGHALPDVLDRLAEVEEITTFRRGLLRRRSRR